MRASLRRKKKPGHKPGREESRKKSPSSFLPKAGEKTAFSFRADTKKKLCNDHFAWQKKPTMLKSSRKKKERI